MRLSQQTEWAIIAGLILYIAFTPGFQVVREFLSTGIGKAVGLAVIVGAWKYLSPLIALLLLVNFVRCASMREYADDPSIQPTATGPPPNTHCPENYTFDNGQCKNKTTGQTIPATICLEGQTWDGSKCSGSSAASTPPPAMAPPMTTSSTTTKQPFTNMTPAMVGGVQPDLKETMGNYAPV
jgi:hypothetical protein